MVNVAFYKTQEYREVIASAFEGREGQKKRTFASAAAYCQVQPTYFSNVIKGRADFNDDQIFSLCEYLNLSVEEADFLKACHQWARSGLKERKKTLQARIQELRENALSPASRFKVPKIEKLRSEDEIIYFLDPMHQILAHCVEVSPETKNIEKIKSALSLSDDRTNTLLENLTKSGRLQIDKNKFVKAPLTYHLGADSKVLFQHQANLRQLSLERMRQLNRKDFKAFSVTFGGSKKEKAAIEEVLTGALEKIRKIVDDSDEKADTVYQINFDFLPWFSV
jgi:hypothetical protein